jgi:hypothetical protein
MTGRWSVQLEDGQHLVQADLSIWTTKLKVYFDNNLIHTKYVLMMIGDIFSFQMGRHYFVISVKGLGGLGGSLALAVNGTYVNPEGMLAPPPPQQPLQHRPFQSPAQYPPPAQFVEEVNVVETSEVYRTEEYPFDNRYGDSPVSTERQFSEESTNEFALGTTNKLNAKLNLDAFALLKAEVAAEVSKQVGHKIGEKVTESQTLNFSVGPKSAVVYRIIWKRNIRTGEYVYLVNGTPVSFRYRMKYGLSVEVQTRQHGTSG